jgi:hypothetical protein
LHTPLRTMAGLDWSKRRAGCYVLPIGDTGHRAVLLRNGAFWFAHLMPATGGAPLWTSQAEDGVGAAARAARLYLRENYAFAVLPGRTV